MHMKGLAETINAVRAKGYTEDFNLPDAVLDQNKGVLRTADDEFVVDQVYRFDVMTDPGDQSVLYAIRSLRTGAKGIIVNGYGIYSESPANRKLQAVHRWKNDLDEAPGKSSA